MDTFEERMKTCEQKHWGTELKMAAKEGFCLRQQDGNVCWSGIKIKAEIVDRTVKKEPARKRAIHVEAREDLRLDKLRSAMWYRSLKGAGQD